MTLEEAIGIIIAKLGSIRVPVSETQIASGIKEAIGDLRECIEAIRRSSGQDAEPEENGGDGDV